MLSTAGAIKRQIVGQITANGTTAVSITVPNLKEDSILLPSLNTVGGTPDGAPYVFSKNVTTGAVEFKSAAGDTSVYDIVYLA